MIDKSNPKDYTVHMIGNAHIDPIWLWRLDEGRKEVWDTCRSALDRMKETPEFVFCRSSAATYLWIEEDDPEMFEEIRERVKEGRWHVVNGWWEQPDCNVPGGESYVRHALYSKQYFMEKLGVEPTVGYNVDTFGHNGSLPQILSKTGFTSYVFFRPEPGREKQGLPQVFWWESADGSRVLASRPPHYYGFGSDTKELHERIMTAWEQTMDGLNHVMCFYGVGNHGGGPTKINIQSILEASDIADMPRTPFSKPEDYFEAVLAQGVDLPVVKDDLQHHAVGCYSVVTAVKAFNRRCEQDLMASERFAALANTLADLPFPAGMLQEAWQDVLFNQFHDILAGTSLTSAYEDVYNMYAKSLETADTVTKQSLRTLARKVDTRGKGLAVTVFNPNPWNRRDVVEVEVEVAVEPYMVRMTDCEGNEIPVQIAEKNVGGAGGTVTVMFVADVPAHGYSVYRVMMDEMPEVVSSTISYSPTALANDILSLEVDPVSGAISSLKLGNGPNLLGEKGVSLVVLKDTSDTWSHAVKTYDEELGRFVANGSVRVVEEGPVRATLEVTGTFGKSEAVQRISIYPGIDRVDVDVTVNFLERHRMLKLSVATAAKDGVPTYEIPYGFMVREANGEEDPAQKWMDVTGTVEGAQRGVSLVNADRYGFDSKDGEMRMSVLRTAIYAFHEPRKVLPKERYHYCDLGEGTFRFSLVPHEGDWRGVNTPRAGEEFNTPMVAFIEPFHGGRLPKTGSALLEIGPENVVGTILKKSQKGDALIVRMYESHGKDGVARVRLPEHGIDVEVPIGHDEIKTLAFDLANPKAAPVEVDMLERAGK